MEQRWDQEHNGAGNALTVSHLHHGDVDVPHGPAVNRHVPRAPERVDVVGVPPVVVEVAVRKVHQLSHQVEEGVEVDVEETQPYQMVWNL